ncbi:hypothetical protein SEPCBS119000_005363 [Sporothrix epigloea]|uniref:SH3 domain-containing protein n=1 Tax=Sporothrix epigloea TaxID=1892477 RepID=A0ABP0E064_9PEZI
MTSKRDLGFMEGDLIECLNAGDGSWWTGRLWRDRRMVGSFPSNFVELLPPDFRPISRSTSPLPTNATTPSTKNTPQKSRTFRKPFEAYAKAPHYTTAKQPEIYKPGTERTRDTSITSSISAGVSSVRKGDISAGVPARMGSEPVGYRQRSKNDDLTIRHQNNDSIDKSVRASSPSPYHVAKDHSNGSRSPSPSPRINSYAPGPHHQPLFHSQSQSQQQAPFQNHYQPSPTPVLMQQDSHQHNTSRGPSPAPTLAFQQTHRSPLPEETIYQPYRPTSAAGQLDSPPPPPPPPHRQTVNRQDFGTSCNDQEQMMNSGMQSLGRHGSGMSYTGHSSLAGYHTPRAPSPVPSPGPIETGLTPSPLREAMDDVMEQLDALGMSREHARTPEPPRAAFDAWSPESFNSVHQNTRRLQHRKDQMRPQTSMGITQPIDEGYESYSGTGSGKSSQYDTHGTRQWSGERLPQLKNYVERMESRLHDMHQQHQSRQDHLSGGDETHEFTSMPSAQTPNVFERPKSSMSGVGAFGGETSIESKVQQLRHRQSAYDVGRQVLNRTFTTKTNSTNASSGNRSTVTTASTNTQSSSRSLMSGISASGISATSAGSLARKNHSRAQSALGLHEWEQDRPDSPFTGVTYHSSHASDYQQNAPGRLRSKSQIGFNSSDEMPGLGGFTSIGGLAQPKSVSKKSSNIFKKIIDHAKTGVASSRGSIAMTSFSNTDISTGIGSQKYPRSSQINSSGNGRETGLGAGSGGGLNWVQVRRDVNRSNSLSRIERNERRDRCQMLDYPTLDPVDELYNTIEGDEDANGMPVPEPTNYAALNLSQVDKNSRFINSLPPVTTAVTLSTTYVCRPYRSDVQRLRAIFTWVSEKIVWEEDYGMDGVANEGLDTCKVIQSRRGCAKEYAALIAEMCDAAGLSCEVVRGYLKAPGDIPELGITPRSNHWWNAVLVDNEWRIMDCCIASPSFPRRGQYSSGGCSSTTADPWWFLVQPSEACYTHIPEHHTQQHLCPPVAPEILQNLPCAGPPYFLNGLQLMDFNTSLLRIEDLEMVHVRFSVPEDVEVAAEIEVRALKRDADGDYFESGDVLKKRVLAQADWIAGGIKRYTIKGLLPGDEGTGTLKVYAGRRGLMHSIKDIPHPLAFSLPVVHTGENPAYEFVTRHPTPHAQRHDIYVVQPQCQRLALNNTFVFAIRQHPSSVGGATPVLPSISQYRASSPSPFVRPSSAMSMLSSVNSGVSGLNNNMIPAGSVSCSSQSSGSSSASSKKPAKLAIQTPGGKILRLMRKEDRSKNSGIGVGGRSSAMGSGRYGEEDPADGGTWETIIKCSERGVWRGLVLADRSARWCVFAEWMCQ